MATTKHLCWGFAAVCLGLIACGDDAATKAEKCPAGFAVNQTQDCSCGDSGTGMQACQADGNLSACDCTGGGATAGTLATAGTMAGTGGTGVGVAGTAGGTSGTTATDDEDGGTSGAGTGGSDKDGGTTAGTDKPAADGKQLSSCDPNADMPCGKDLNCYTAGATTVGYCTTSCKVDDDCKDLKGGAFTCSSPSGMPATRSCRVSCTGPDDKTCPEYMSCTQVQGGYRCLYDEKDVGDGTAKRYEKCTGDGDCSGDLVCYTATGGIGLPGGQSYSGYCTNACGGDDECKDAPKTGSADLACGTTGQCRLSCSMGGPTGGGMMTTCPDGMTCINLGDGTNRCLYAETTGGI